ncbi:opioid growth factor receptor-like protein 1 isoform X2 [Crassostrea virginica]
MTFGKNKYGHVLVQMKKKKSLLDDDSSYFSSYRHNDLEQYRKGYPGKKDDRSKKDNEKFYKNKLKSYPDGDLIENILKNWMGDYERLERHHGYIQWLFPIRETGMNFHAQELQGHEINAIMDDSEAFGRVLRSYEMMLDFYGMELSDKETGKISRAKNWKDRFPHLNRSYHNYLRITRILKFLGEFGYENYKRPFVEFVLEEAMEHGTLLNTLESCVRYWLETIKSEDERKQLRDYVRKMEAGHTSPFEEDSDELVSSKKVDKMIEKSKQNQEEFVSEEENGTFKSKTKRHPDFENASNNANKAAMERGDTRDPAREAEDGNDVEKENNDSEKLLENEEMKEKLQNQAMEVGEKSNSSKEAADGNDDEKEKRDSEILLKKEEEMMKMQNQAMEVDSGEDAQLDVMDTSGTANEASLLTSKSTIV